MATWGSADAKVIRALGNPLRLRILDLIASSGETSPVRLAQLLDQPLATVSHHVRLLRDLGFLELTRTAPRRGAVEHFYRVKLLPFLTDAEWEELPHVLRHGLAAQTFRGIFAVAAAAGSAGAFDEPGACLTRTSLTLDAQGRRELSSVLMDTLCSVEQIQRASEERNPDTGSVSAGRASASEFVILHFAGRGYPTQARSTTVEPRGSLPIRVQSGR